MTTTTQIGWGLSVANWRWHAIGEHGGEHAAECGQELLAAIPLHDEPHGPLCPDCTAAQLDAASGRGAGNPTGGTRTSGRHVGGD